MKLYRLKNIETIEQFIITINKARLENKGRWYKILGRVNGKYIEIKAFGTWLQILRIDGVENSNIQNMKPTEFKQFLRSLYLEVIAK